MIPSFFFSSCLAKSFEQANDDKDVVHLVIFDFSACMINVELMKALHSEPFISKESFPGSSTLNMPKAILINSSSAFYESQLFPHEKIYAFIYVFRAWLVNSASMHSSSNCASLLPTISGNRKSLKRLNSAGK